MTSDHQQQLDNLLDRVRSCSVCVGPYIRDIVHQRLNQDLRHKGS